MALSILDRLQQKTIIDNQTGCWLFIGSNDGRKGYGKIKFQGKKVATHRVSAHLHLGLDLTDKNLHALHKLICPNKSCWNPQHLYIGTNRDNINDTIKSGILHKRKHCKQNELTNYFKLRANK